MPKIEPMAHEFEVAVMRRAIDLAQQSPYVSPNPKVACVLLDSAGQEIAAGVHQGPGQAHAEIVALQQAGVAAVGATAVVTLEPCNHEGRTGPCSSALIAAGVSRVIYAVPDPNPAASGGAAALTTAGVAVLGGVLEAEAAELNRSWLYAVTHGRPWVIAKVAATLDGKVAASDGSSKWITGAPARELGHELRGQVDAIAVGTNTVVADDPQLTDRRPAATRQPLRVVLGSTSLAGTAAIFDGAAETIQLADHDPEAILTNLFDRGVRTLVIEGGPTVQAAFLAADLVDELAWFVAPKILGAGHAAVADLGIATLANARSGKLISTTQTGEDVLLKVDLRHN